MGETSPYGLKIHKYPEMVTIFMEFSPLFEFSNHFIKAQYVF
jgi:hypothetical protein